MRTMGIRTSLGGIAMTIVGLLAVGCGAPVERGLSPSVQTTRDGNLREVSSKMLRPYAYHTSACFSVSYPTPDGVQAGTPGVSGAPAFLAWSCAEGDPLPGPITLTLDFGDQRYRIGEVLYTLPPQETGARPKTLVVDLGPVRPLRSLDISGFRGGETAVLRLDSEEAVDTVDVRVVGLPASKPDGVEVPLGSVAVFERE